MLFCKKKSEILFTQSRGQFQSKKILNRHFLFSRTLEKRKEKENERKKREEEGEKEVEEE